MTDACGLTRVLRCPQPLDIGLTVGPLVRGAYDPTAQLGRDELRRAMHTPDGTATVHARASHGSATVDVRAWGPGRTWIVEHARDLLGLDDDAVGFVPGHPVVAALARTHRGLRLARLRVALDVAVATVIDQRVTGVEAARSWRALVRRHGVPAPGPFGLQVPPGPEVLGELPDWAWRRLGIEGRRAGAIRALARDASRVDAAAARGAAALDRRLRSMRGIGPWTAAIVVHHVTGDPDAVPVGDWHLPGHVGFALAGNPAADDAAMLALLEPFRPHRARVWRLILAGAPAPPRRAPRARIVGLLAAESRRGVRSRISA